MSKETTKNAKNGADNSAVQGEGDYRSARVYKKDIDAFVEANKGKIPDLAKAAEKALKGDEGAELRKAEDAGKAKARH